TTYKSLPHGAASRHYGTWVMAVLPFLEQTAIYDQYVPLTKYMQPPNRDLLEIRLAAYSCPSDSRFSSWTANDIPNYNYVVNLGNTSNFRAPTLNGVTFQKSPFFCNNNGGSLPPDDVPFYRFADIRDGTSNTLMMLEIRQGRNDNDLRGLTVWGPGSGCTAHNGPNTSVPDYLDGGWCPAASFNLPGWPCQLATSANPVNCSARSYHPGGVVVALCDGSVRFVTDGIDLTTWRGLSTMNHGEILGEY
ncbi:MAG: DUF1559 domain-containing protein, partial [Planctomycetales bacterium]|nr:DUF1559 domain-containing protein [Planctomycetales bacterium]